MTSRTTLASFRRSLSCRSVQPCLVHAAAWVNLAIRIVSSVAKNLFVPCDEAHSMSNSIVCILHSVVYCCGCCGIEICPCCVGPLKAA